MGVLRRRSPSETRLLARSFSSCKTPIFSPLDPTFITHTLLSHAFSLTLPPPPRHGSHSIFFSRNDIMLHLLFKGMFARLEKHHSQLSAHVKHFPNSLLVMQPNMQPPVKRWAFKDLAGGQFTQTRTKTASNLVIVALLTLVTC